MKKLGFRLQVLVFTLVFFLFTVPCTLYPAYAHALPHNPFEWTLFGIFTGVPIIIFILIFLKQKDR